MNNYPDILIYITPVFWGEVIEKSCGGFNLAFCKNQIFQV
jgi:hypothetical protein